jgi:hypothetical protein
MIDSIVTPLNSGAAGRDFMRFPVSTADKLGKSTYEEEIKNLKAWLLGRLAFMDSHFTSGATK